MDFLALCQATARESGTVAGLPSFNTVTGASGRLEKLVNWVRDAWIGIQNERTDWLFRIASFSEALTIEQMEYTGASFDLELAAWLPDTAVLRTMSLYDPAIGQSDEGPLSQRSWATWRQTYDRGIHDPLRPSMWAIAPDGSLVVGPKPDKAYVLRGQYRRKAQRLAVDGDIPIMPEDFHGLIVGEALRLMARADEAFQVLAEKSQRYEQLRAPLVIDQTPQIYSIQGEPIA